MQNDYLVRMGTNPMARSIVNTLRLPIPLPQELDRPGTPWADADLAGRMVVVGHLACTAASGPVAQALAATQADLWLQGEEDSAGLYAAGKAKPVPAGGLPEQARLHALVFDATGLESPQDLKGLYAFFHPLVKRIAPCGRAIVIACAPDHAGTLEASVAARAVEGFARSLGREIGRKGSTSNLILVEPGAEDRVGPVTRFLLSARSAFITGQPLRISARAQGGRPAAQVAPLEGQVAVVTGAARGIGEATARALAREGAHVVIMDRPEEDALGRQVAESIHGTWLPADITNPDASAALIALIQQTLGHLDIVVHNAGITRDKTLGNMDEARWDQVLNVNLISLMRLNQALLPHFRSGGRVICLSSIGGISGNMGQTNYAASKAGVIGYVQALAPAVADRGITVNAIAPGFIETRMTAAMPFGTREGARRLSNLGQGGHPEDVAEAITFLASPGASGLTGQVLRVCGGNYIGA